MVLWCVVLWPFFCSERRPMIRWNSFCTGAACLPDSLPAAAQDNNHSTPPHTHSHTHTQTLADKNHARTYTQQQQTCDACRRNREERMHTRDTRRASGAFNERNTHSLTTRTRLFFLCCYAPGERHGCGTGCPKLTHTHTQTHFVCVE